MTFECFICIGSDVALQHMPVDIDHPTRKFFETLEGREAYIGSVAHANEEDSPVKSYLKACSRANKLYGKETNYHEDLARKAGGAKCLVFVAVEGEEEEKKGNFGCSVEQKTDNMIKFNTKGMDYQIPPRGILLVSHSDGVTNGLSLPYDVSESEGVSLFGGTKELVLFTKGLLCQSEEYAESGCDGDDDHHPSNITPVTKLMITVKEDESRKCHRITDIEGITCFDSRFSDYQREFGPKNRLRKYFHDDDDDNEGEMESLAKSIETIKGHCNDLKEKVDVSCKGGRVSVYAQVKGSPVYDHCGGNDEMEEKKAVNIPHNITKAVMAKCIYEYLELNRKRESFSSKSFFCEFMRQKYPGIREILGKKGYLDAISIESLFTGTSGLPGHFPEVEETLQSFYDDHVKGEPAHLNSTLMHQAESISPCTHQRTVTHICDALDRLPDKSDESCMHVNIDSQIAYVLICLLFREFSDPHSTCGEKTNRMEHYLKKNNVPCAGHSHYGQICMSSWEGIKKICSILGDFFKRCPVMAIGTHRVANQPFSSVNRCGMPVNSVSCGTGEDREVISFLDGIKKIPKDDSHKESLLNQKDMVSGIFVPEDGFVFIAQCTKYDGTKKSFSETFEKACSEKILPCMDQNRRGNYPDPDTANFSAIYKHRAYPNAHFASCKVKNISFVCAGQCDRHCVDHDADSEIIKDISSTGQILTPFYEPVFKKVVIEKPPIVKCVIPPGKCKPVPHTIQCKPKVCKTRVLPQCSKELVIVPHKYVEGLYECDEGCDGIQYDVIITTRKAGNTGCFSGRGIVTKEEVFYLKCKALCGGGKEWTLIRLGVCGNTFQVPFDIGYIERQCIPVSDCGPSPPFIPEGCDSPRDVGIRVGCTVFLSKGIVDDLCYRYVTGYDERAAKKEISWSAADPPKSKGFGVNIDGYYHNLPVASDGTLYGRRIPVEFLGRRDRWGGEPRWLRNKKMAWLRRFFPYLFRGGSYGYNRRRLFQPRPYYGGPRRRGPRPYYGGPRRRGPLPIAPVVGSLVGGFARGLLGGGGRRGGGRGGRRGR